MEIGASSVSYMNNCAKCGKELSFLERHKTGGSDMGSFLNALKSGRFQNIAEKRYALHVCENY